jgi:alkylhydroperoxidase family enzyme
MCRPSRKGCTGQRRDRAAAVCSAGVARDAVLQPSRTAALAWTEAVTEIGRSGVSDALYDEARAQFTEKELVDLTVAVIAINAWNRFAVTFRPAVGSYKPAAATTAVSA